MKYQVMIIILSLIIVPLQIRAEGGWNVYVWDFTTRDGARNDLTRNFTREFEGELIRDGCCKVLERRHFDRLIAQKDNEKAVLALEDVSPESIDGFKTIGAGGFVFGEILDDVESGEIDVKVTLQVFTGEKAVFESIRFSRGKRLDGTSRETKMRELAGKFCRSLKNLSPGAASREKPPNSVETATYTAVGTASISYQHDPEAEKVSPSQAELRRRAIRVARIHALEAISLKLGVEVDSLNEVVMGRLKMRKVVTRSGRVLNDLEFHEPIITGDEVSVRVSARVR